MHFQKMRALCISTWDLMLENGDLNFQSVGSQMLSAKRRDPLLFALYSNVHLIHFCDEIYLVYRREDPGRA